MLTSPSSPLVQSSTTYIGQIFYNTQGNVIDETGHDNPVVADQRIKAMEKNLIGKWAFAVLKTKRKTKNGAEELASAVLFPDGKSRKLVAGEVSIDAPKSKGTWITQAAANKALADAKSKVTVRLAVDVRFPWKTGSVNCRMERFPTMLAFEQWVAMKVQPTDFLFIVNPAANVLPPDEEGLFAWLAVVPA